MRAEGDRSIFCTSESHEHAHGTPNVARDLRLYVFARARACIPVRRYASGNRSRSNVGSVKPRHDKPRPS